MLAWTHDPWLSGSYDLLTKLVEEYSLVSTQLSNQHGQSSWQLYQHAFLWLTWRVYSPLFHPISLVATRVYCSLFLLVERYSPTWGYWQRYQSATFAQIYWCWFSGPVLYCNWASCADWSCISCERHLFFVGSTLHIWYVVSPKTWWFLSFLWGENTGTTLISKKEPQLCQYHLSHWMFHVTLSSFVSIIMTVENLQ